MSFTSWRLGAVTALRVLSELEEECDDLFPMGGFERIAAVLGLEVLGNMNKPQPLSPQVCSQLNTDTGNNPEIFNYIAVNIYVLPTLIVSLSFSLSAHKQVLTNFPCAHNNESLTRWLNGECG